MLLTTPIQRIEKNPVSGGLNVKSPKCYRLLLVSYRTFTESLIKIHSSIFHKVANRYPAAPRGTRNSLVSRERVKPIVLLCRTRHISNFIKKIVNPFCRNVANKYGSRKKKNPVSKGLNVTSQKCHRLFLMWCPTYPENWMNIYLPVFL